MSLNRVFRLFGLICTILLSTLFSFKTSYSFEIEMETDRNNDSISTANLLSQRIFFMLYSIENSASTKSLFLKNDKMKDIYHLKVQGITHALKNCKDMGCLVNTLLVNDKENREVISILGNMYGDNRLHLQSFMRNQIRPSHNYEFYSNYSDSALFIEAWEEEIAGMNYIYKAYTQNKGFHYAKIDSSLFQVNSQDYLNRVKGIIEDALANDSGLFFKMLKDIAIKLLQINGRDEAVAFMPLSIANKMPYARIADIKWEDFPFSGILILGEGPEDPKLNISQGSKIRARMGAELYRDGKAPFIVVSGGSVHPIHTPFFEAVEMKRFLVDSLGIPNEVIIIEPHARHTTTNLRNTNRIFLENGIPRNKSILTVTVKSHIDFILSDRFTKTYLRDIGYIAYSGLRRLSDTTISYYPTMSSFQINCMDPLDP